MNWSAIKWGSVADWLSGLGSFSAVIVALCLSRSAQYEHRGMSGLFAFKSTQQMVATLHFDPMHHFVKLFLPLSEQKMPYPAVRWDCAKVRSPLFLR